MSEEVSRAYWDGRHRVERSMGNPEPFVREVLPLLPKSGIALDIGAGRGRHAIALADHGLSVVAVDYSSEAIRALSGLAHAHPATIWPLLADLDTFPFEPQSLDVIVNVNFLDRDLFPAFIRALKPGGMLLADTFSIEALGHPRILPSCSATMSCAHCSRVWNWYATARDSQSMLTIRAHGGPRRWPCERKPPDAASDDL